VLSNLESYSQDLVLIGGGHSHAIVLKLLAVHPLVGVRVTLISDVTDTPYSGMLPGHVAGFYSYAETHIDLRRLAKIAGVEFHQTAAIGLDLVNKWVICADNYPPIQFDYLSIDIGSTPEIDTVTGATEYGIKAKPVPQFLAAWDEIVAVVKANPDRSIRLAIVGGGAGGVELGLNMQQRLPSCKIHLVHSGTRLLPNHNLWVSRRLENICRTRQIRLYLQERVREVLVDRIICNSGSILEYDYLFWVTRSSAPSWLKESGLATDDRGFILVNNYLQSLSHPHIFAAGDILSRLIRGEKLQEYIPQTKYLALIGTGDRAAIASWGNFGWQSSFFWGLKDQIDRSFMAQFS
jgi:selenide, water dikinase